MAQGVRSGMVYRQLFDAGAAGCPNLARKSLYPKKIELALGSVGLSHASRRRSADTIQHFNLARAA
jgi:hypothetical protein